MDLVSSQCHIEILEIDVSRHRVVASGLKVYGDLSADRVDRIVEQVLVYVATIGYGRDRGDERGEDGVLLLSVAVLPGLVAYDAELKRVFRVLGDSGGHRASVDDFLIIVIDDEGGCRVVNVPHGHLIAPRS